MRITIAILLCFVSLLVFVYNDVNARSISESNDDESLTSQVERDWLSPRQRTKRQSPKNRRKPNEHRHNPEKFLEKFGYLRKIRDGERHDPIKKKNAIKKFQRMYRLRESGRLDEETLSAMQSPRCGMPDFNISSNLETDDDSTGSVGQLAENLASGYKWHKTDLTYRIQNFFNSPTLDQQTQRRALERAFRIWSDVTPLTFREVSGGADINIMFAAGEHGDGIHNAFDGSGGVLAHAYFPESGETHFDEDEDWRDSESQGIDLMTVAAHEIGHALGLSHTSFPGALMAPYYQGYDPAFSLTQDDISAIQSVYGGGDPRYPTTTTTTTTRPPPTTTTQSGSDQTSDSCTVAFQAATQIYDRSVHVFSGSMIWRITDSGLDSSYPQTILSVYRYAPPTVDAAIFSTKTYYTYLYKGDKVWRYYGFRLLGGRTFDTTGNSVPAMAAITDATGNIFLIKGPMCWLFDETTMTVDPVPRQCIQVFPNALYNIDSAIRLTEEPNIIYYFRGPYYYKYNENTRRFEDGYPKLKAAPWMGPTCGGQAYSPR